MFRPLVLAFVLATLSGGLVLEASAQRSDIDPKKQDVLKLKNGREFRGRLIAEDAKSITFEFRGSEIVLPARLVKKIIRGERRAVEANAEKPQKNMGSANGRHEEREEHYFVYYRGRRVGWRQSTLRRATEGNDRGYRFDARTVFLRGDGQNDVDLQVSEFVDRDLRPRIVSVNEQSQNFSELRHGVVTAGHLKIKRGSGTTMEESEILFTRDTELLMPLLRRLGDASHFPAKGKSFKVFDPVDQRFIRVRARRESRKEVVANKHQYVTVWKLESGPRHWEVWFDGYGGIIREELGSPHMVAVRAKKDLVMAYSRGEGKGGDPELSLEYENTPLGFRLVRPNLTWSFDFPSDEGAVVTTLVNPTLQASVDVICLEKVGVETEAETILMDLLNRMRRHAGDAKVLYQKKALVGGCEGLRFEIQAERKEVQIQTVGVVCRHRGKAYAMLLAAPRFRWKDAQPQLERILGSFEIIGATAPEPEKTVTN
ncbi:MAG: hypothetical protein V3W41_19835 [Planctomycetota bacterium]